MPKTYRTKKAYHGRGYVVKKGAVMTDLLLDPQDIKEAICLREAEKIGRENPVTEENPTGDAGDFHCWCENAAGEVLGDKDFMEYKMIRAMRNLQDTPIYKRWDEEHEVAQWKRCQGRMRAQIQRFKDHKKKHGFGEPFWDEFKNGGQFGQCPYNACQYMKEQRKLGNNDVRICVGSMGWKKKDGNVFWEFGGGDNGESYVPHK